MESWSAVAEFLNEGLGYSIVRAIFILVPGWVLAAVGLLVWTIGFVSWTGESAMRTGVRLVRPLVVLVVLAGVNAIAMPEAARAQTVEELEAMQVPLLRHRPIYFAFSDEESKIQISFRFRFGDESNLNLAYTQTVFWALNKDSVPVEETRYRPELFYSFQLGSSWVRRLNVGFNEHDSNGLDGDASRSYDASYLETVSYLDPGQRDIRWVNRVFDYYRLGPANRDIKYYRSTLETELDYHAGFLENDRVMLRAVLRQRREDEEESGHGIGAYEIGYRFPIPYATEGSAQFYVQYYNGYNETWRDYDERTQSLRAGFMLR